MSYDEKRVTPTDPPAVAPTVAPASPLTLKERIKARKELVKARIISWGHDIDALLRDYFHVSGGPYYYQVAAQESQLLLPSQSTLFCPPFLLCHLTRFHGRT